MEEIIVFDGLCVGVGPDDERKGRQVRLCRFRDEKTGDVASIFVPGTSVKEGDEVQWVLRRKGTNVLEPNTGA